MTTVKLTYFKRSGKYYSESEYHTMSRYNFAIAEEIKKMEALPGLYSSFDQGNFIVHYVSDDEKYSVPGLLVPNPKEQS